MSAVRFMALLTLCSVFAALISIVWQAIVSLKQLNRITTILTVFLSIESSNKRLITPKIAIGYGACSDLLINGIQFLNFTESVLYKEGTKDLFSEEISSSEELLQNFAYFFKNGAAAERFVTDSGLFRELVEKAKTEHREDIRWFLGGNAALMGLRFHIEGAEVLLGAQMSKKLRRLVPDEVQITGNPLEEDEIHVILEYKSGDKWGNLTAPRANRFIVHNDHNNPQLRVLEAFGEALKMFQPRLLVVTNLHVMDKYKFDPGMREERLIKVQQQLATQPASTLTHFEMASYVDNEMLNILCRNVIPYVDSLGMNEQELSNLHAILRTGKTVPLVDWNLDIAVTLDQIRFIYQHIFENYKLHSGKRMLSRIHVHTLAYQIVLTERGSSWQNSKAAAAKASLIAHRYVCQTDMINPESATLMLPDKYFTSMLSKKRQAILMDVKNPVACWNENIDLDVADKDTIEIQICVAPVLVCRIAKKTSGAGDNISAASLMQQL